MDKYRPSHIDIKNAITFVFLKMKIFYDARYQSIFFKIGDLINLQFYREYQISIIMFKKIES